MDEDIQAYNHHVQVLKDIKLPAPYELFVMPTLPLVVRIGVEASKDNVTGEPFSWHGRRWPLSTHMTDGEIVQTVFLALQTAMEHETREQFTYQGVAVFDPHWDISQLVALGRLPTSKAFRTPPPIAAEGDAHLAGALGTG